jgi:hypothetical protein
MSLVDGRCLTPRVRPVTPVSCGRVTFHAPDPPSRTEVTQLPTRHPSTRPHDRRIMPALVAAALVLGLALEGASGKAVASTVSIAAGHGTNVGSPDHGHACKCRMHCKSACCCAPDRTTATRVEPVPMRDPATPAPDTSGPCVKAAPCGDAAVPAAAPGVVIGAKAATLAETEIRPATAGTLIPIPPGTAPPPAAPARVDEPPEARGRA